ncbi:DUF305 domain-containing protein [Synechococcus sp. JA-3-3Ab]|uniref:DUF305 domain-containing protein n=1 Tax=Synechococcus sp. (strain JA-3-3Ab) TaxID=321327 RepID=UPI0003120111|nr:DUF305 domain-containing protein [Synechococcus sp. JA-3-3Ab]
MRLTVCALILAGGFVLGASWAGRELEATAHESKGKGELSIHRAHQISLGPADESFDLRFLDAMILHHEGAVSMAAEALQKSRRREIRQLAKDILAAQSQEIKQMQGWRLSWYPLAPQEPVMWHEEMGHQMAMTPEMISAMRMDTDLGAADPEFDLRFLQAMIQHHEGALVMAREALEKSKCPEIRQLATAIVTTQQAEIEQMRAWQKRWYLR